MEIGDRVTIVDVDPANWGGADNEQLRASLLNEHGVVTARGRRWVSVHLDNNHKELEALGYRTNDLIFSETDVSLEVVVIHENPECTDVLYLREGIT